MRWIPSSWRRIGLAVACLIAIAGIGWMTIEGLNWAADSALRSGRVARAESRFRWATLLSLGRADCLFGQARCERRLGRLIPAVEHLRLAEKRGYDRVAIELQHELMRLQAGHLEGREALLSRLSALGADDVLAEEFYEAVAQGCMVQHRLSDALQVLSYWIDWKPDAARARFMRADIWQQTEQTTAAQNEYLRAFQLDPELVEAKSRAAQILANGGEFASALALFRELRAAGPLQAIDLMLMAKCCEQEGLFAEALAIAREAEHAPGINSQIRAQAEATLCRILTHQQQLDVARGHGRRAVELDPYHEAVHQAYGLVLARLGETELAAQERARAGEISHQRARYREIVRELVTQPTNADLQYEAGAIYRQLGEPDAARYWWTAALASNPNHVAAKAGLAELPPAVLPAVTAKAGR
jgi:tetratricopeptide (TPR) repeat protein